MAKLIYTAICSLDGYIEDEEGNFDWAAPDEDVYAFVNDLERPIGTSLYGRRMYETLAVWETEAYLGDRQPVVVDFAAIWRATDKVVFSRTLETVVSARTRIERAFEPDQIREMKTSAGRDLSIGGAELAAHAFRAGLVDECHLLLNPIIVGGGRTRFADRSPHPACIAGRRPIRQRSDSSPLPRCDVKTALIG